MPSKSSTKHNSILQVSTLQGALALADVTVSTASTGSQAGDITVAAPITWSNNSALTLSAFRNIAVNANITNTASFDIPQNNVNQNVAFNNVPIAVDSTSEALPTGCGTNNPEPGGLYNCPVGLGITKHTIGSPREIQMSLHLDF